MRRLILGAVALATAACTRQASVQSDSGGPVQQTAMACSPTVGALESPASVTSIAGEHELRLVATAGPKSGRSVNGTMSISASASGAEGTGSARIALDSVGAVAPGDASVLTASRWSTANGAGMMIRFGSTAAGQIEGSFTALELTLLTANDFRGTWKSEIGGTTGGGASGYFCARRAAR